MIVSCTVKCKSFAVENFGGFRGLASNRESFSANFSLLLAIRCFELLYNRESFPANNNKIMQPWNFSTANDLHYTVYEYFNLVFHISKLKKLIKIIYHSYNISINVLIFIKHGVLKYCKQLKFSLTRVWWIWWIVLFSPNCIYQN